MLQPTGTDGGTLFVKWTVTSHANDSTNVHAVRLMTSVKKRARCTLGTCQNAIYTVCRQRHCI